MAVVLSGTGADGAEGVRSIKAQGGMVMAQIPESTEFDGMPRSAIATGLVDFQMLPEQMAAQLMMFEAAPDGGSRRVRTIVSSESTSVLEHIFELLRQHTGHDFSLYKPGTVHRRIERRMMVQQIETLDAYAKYLQRTPNEADALFRDLLIGVTAFFRDTDAFESFAREAIPASFAGKAAGDVIRVWCAGCSTGEEAYSVAMLLTEHMDAIGRRHSVQVFATDIDSNAISSARIGVFPADIAESMTPERLARHFVIEPGDNGYRVRKNIRDMVIFSEQNVIRDPPFSKLDAIVCRNLLIYLEPLLQQRLIPIFHYALRSGGVLFLGTSEGIGEFTDLFTQLDRKARLYARVDDMHGIHRSVLTRTTPAASLTDNVVMRRTAGVTSKRPLRELAEQAILSHLEPSAALVTAQGDVLYIHGRMGMFLEPPQGVAGVNNILRMAREGLRRDLAASLHKASVTREIVRVGDLNVRTNGHTTNVHLCVRPVTGGLIDRGATMFLVVLEHVAPAQGAESRSPSLETASGNDADADALRQELRAKEEYLHNMIEELESSGEELKSSNEELQPVNEELQSTNEELQTSKEELQSVNEELATVNTELQNKVADLSRTNNDMNNLLAGTGIGTVFVDHKLRILRFTPAASQIMNLIPGDIGRPVGHMASTLVGYDSLVEDVESVLATLVPKEATVQTRAGRWFTLRILPYRTLENVIEGAVINFVDVIDVRTARQRIADNESASLAILSAIPATVIVSNQDGTITYINQPAAHHPENNVIGSNWLDWISPSDRANVIQTMGRVIRTSLPESLRLFAPVPHGSAQWFDVQCLRLNVAQDIKLLMIARELAGNSASTSNPAAPSP